MRATRFLIVAAVLGLAGVTACATTSPAPTEQNATSPANLSCAWPSLFSLQTTNIIMLDSTEAAWLQPIVAPTRTTLHLSGRYPDARYFSLSVYTPSGDSFTSNGVDSSLPDYRIAANTGSVNPWQTTSTAGGSYKIDLSAAAASDQPNVLPLPPGTTSAHPGYLVYRVYDPAGGSFSGVPLPSISISHGSATTPLRPCTTRTPAWRPERSPTSSPTSTPSRKATPPPPATFFEPAGGQADGGLVANADASYAEAYLIRPPANEVVVITGKAPTTAPAAHPSPWPNPNVDMRYWSLCVGVGVTNLPTVVNHLPGGTADYGCRDDESTAVDAAGNYTYVLGSESQRAQISTVPGATFLPFETTSSAKLYLLLLRNILVSKGFDHAPHTVTTTDSAAAATAAMGPYYPTIKTCPLAALLKDGAPGCE
ncbi:MAG TPA: hypothetical protein VHX38_34290 [Pseudonocardiaceae bacterium]|jgi:hypothetical protein|nr:hypothetical protein [Pseudonocardiaceae bacterium]